MQGIPQFPRNEPFFSARVLAKKLAPSPHTVKEIFARNLGMRKFV
jgi:hypothetical protein